MNALFSAMKPISEKTVRLLSRSGLVLLFLSMAGSFAMAALSISAKFEEQAWNEMFAMLFTTVMGISVYYIVLAFFGWFVLRKRRVAQEIAQNGTADSSGRTMP